MKKMLNIVFILGALAVLYQFFVMLVMNNHTSKYSVKTADNSFIIDEKYKKSGDYNMYSLLLEDKEKNKFVFSYDVDLNKQTRIIKNILTYKTNDIYCIAPVLKNGIVQNIECNINNELVSYSYLKQISNADTSKFISEIEKSGYKLNEDLLKTYTTKETKDNVAIYKDVPTDLYFTLWNYNSIYILNDSKIEYKDLLQKDSYFNGDFSILDDKYYLTVNTDNDMYNNFYIVNIKDGGKAKIESDYDISKNIYFNGIYKNMAYFTDINNKRQYIIDPYKEEIREVGSSTESKFYDGEKLVNININELTSEKKYFKYDKIPTELSNKYSEYDIKESYGNYYYLDNDGSVYQIVGDNYDLKVKLFKLNDFKEMKVLNNNIFGISYDTVYMYNNTIGLQKAVENRELIFNSKNIYDVYQK